MPAQCHQRRQAPYVLCILCTASKHAPTCGEVCMHPHKHACIHISAGLQKPACIHISGKIFLKNRMHSHFREDFFEKSSGQILPSGPLREASPHTGRRIKFAFRKSLLILRPLLRIRIPRDIFKVNPVIS